MILIHLFYSVVPRSIDTPRMRVFTRAVCVVLFALVLAGAVSRGDEVPVSPPEQPQAGKGNVSIIHVSGAGEAQAEAPAPAHTSKPDEHAEPASTADASGPAPAAESPAHAEPAEGAPSEHAEPAAAVATEHAAEVEKPSIPPTQEHVDTVNPAAPEHATGHGTVPAAVAPAPGHAAPAHVPVVPAPALAHGDGKLEVVDDFAESGRRFWQAGDFVSAEKSFTRALTAKVPVEKKRDLVLEMAGLYRGANQLPKAAAVLEKFIKTYPNDRDVPQVLLQLGAIYRDLGVYSMATSRFFQVLNSTLRVTDEDIPEYRKLAMKARLEIAETYAIQGDLPEAEKYFSRLQLLDLEPADRERVLLRGAQMQFTLKQWLGAEKALASFLAASPESPHVAEVRYMRAKALDELGRKQEAVDEVVALLKMQAPGEADAAKSTAYWKRRCANELANRFYEQGDFLGALAVYQALARASMDPSWRWPAIYQIGLCFERMDMPQRAAEAYDAILAPGTAPTDGTKLPESLVSLQDMAKWRRSHLVWIEDAGKQLQSLSADKPAGT